MLDANGTPDETTPTPLVAVGGNSSAARSARAKLQWRDRYGRWVEMGRGVKFKLRLRNGGIASVTGKFVGSTNDAQYGQVYVTNDPNGLRNGFYHVSSANGQEILASLSPEYLKSRGIASPGTDVNGKSIGERADSDIQDEDTIVFSDAPVGWKVVSNGQDGYPVTWETDDRDYQINRNADGTLTAYQGGRNGQNFNDFAEVLSFIDKVDEGSAKWNKRKEDADAAAQAQVDPKPDAKAAIKAYDSDGALAKRIDEGATANEIFDALSKNKTWAGLENDRNHPADIRNAAQKKADAQHEKNIAAIKRLDAANPDIGPSDNSNSNGIDTERFNVAKDGFLVPTKVAPLEGENITPEQLADYINTNKELLSQGGVRLVSNSDGDAVKSVQAFYAVGTEDEANNLASQNGADPSQIINLGGNAPAQKVDPNAQDSNTNAQQPSGPDAGADVSTGKPTPTAVDQPNADAPAGKPASPAADTANTADRAALERKLDRLNKQYVNATDDAQLARIEKDIADAEDAIKNLSDKIDSLGEQNGQGKEAGKPETNADGRGPQGDSSGVSEPRTDGRGNAGNEGTRPNLAGARKIARPERWDALEKMGLPTPDVFELDPTPENAQKFHDAISKLKENNPYAPSVYVYEPGEYSKMRLFMTEDGTAGVALKDGDEIVSGFVHGDSPHKGAFRSILSAAIAEGGTRGDAFDTILPHLYAQEGFVPVARMKFNDEFAPDGWDKKVFAKYNNGSPDVVFLQYQPDRVDSKYEPGEGQEVTDYDKGLAIARGEKPAAQPDTKATPQNDVPAPTEAEVARFDALPSFNPDDPAQVLQGGVVEEGPDGKLRVRTKAANVLEGTPAEYEPLKYIYRAISEEDYQNIRKNGYMKSDGRKNLAADEGTVATHRNPKDYLPKGTTGVGRIVRIKYDPADNWRVDSDEYLKTDAKIPLERFVGVTEPTRGAGAYDANNPEFIANLGQGTKSDLNDVLNDIRAQYPVGTEDRQPFDQASDDLHAARAIIFEDKSPEALGKYLDRAQEIFDGLGDFEGKDRLQSVIDNTRNLLSEDSAPKQQDAAPAPRARLADNFRGGKYEIPEENQKRLRSDFPGLKGTDKPLDREEDAEPHNSAAFVEVGHPENVDPEAPSQEDLPFTNNPIDPVDGEGDPSSLKNSRTGFEPAPDAILDDVAERMRASKEAAAKQDFGYKDRDEDYAGEKFMPTTEQRDIIQAVLGENNVAVQALAGTGKTSTLELLAKQLQRVFPKKRVLYIAFNKSVQEEAEGRMPGNVESRTGDSLGWVGISRDITNKKNNRDALVRNRDIAAHFGVKGQDTLESDDVSRDIMRAIEAFAISDSDTIGPEHFEGLDTKYTPEVKATADAMWADIASKNGKLKFTNSYATKIWALGKPDLSKLGSGVRNAADIIFFDEAQDINPVMAKVVRDQSIQKVYVGDGRQAIYGFRGAENELDKVEVDYTLPLTQSWRFGPEVAGMGNRFLSLIKSPFKVVGGGPKGDVYQAGTMTDPDAILVRTNTGAIQAILDQLEQGRIVGVSKAFKDDIERLISTARWLKEGGKKPFMHEDLAGYANWDEIEKDVENKKASTKVEMLYNLVDRLGVGGLSKAMMNVKVVAKDKQDAPGEGGLRFNNINWTQGSSGVLAEVPNKWGRMDKVMYALTRPDGQNDGSDRYRITITNSFGIKDELKGAGFRFDGNTKGWFLEDTPENLQRILKQIQVDDATPVDVVVTTAHKAKGLEWKRVRIGDDFRGPKTDIDENTGEAITTFPEPEELRLAYVAVTRAQEALDPGSLSWVLDYTDENDERPDVPSRGIPGQEGYDTTPAAPAAPEAAPTPTATNVQDSPGKQELSSPNVGNLTPEEAQQDLEEARRDLDRDINDLSDSEVERRLDHIDALKEIASRKQADQPDAAPEVRDTYGLGIAEMSDGEIQQRIRDTERDHDRRGGIVSPGEIDILDDLTAEADRRGLDRLPLDNQPEPIREGNGTPQSTPGAQNAEEQRQRDRARAEANPPAPAPAPTPAPVDNEIDRETPPEDRPAEPAPAPQPPTEVPPAEPAPQPEGTGDGLPDNINELEDLAGRLERKIEAEPREARRRVLQREVDRIYDKIEAIEKAGPAQAPAPDAQPQAGAPETPNAPASENVQVNTGDFVGPLRLNPADSDPNPKVDTLPRQHEDFIRNLAEGKDLNPQQQQQVQDAIENDNASGIIDMLADAPNKANTGTKPRPKTPQQELLDNIAPEIRDGQNDPNKIIEANLVIEEVKRQFPRFKTLDNGDLILKTREQNGKRYELAVRRTKRERFFAYIKETDIATGKQRGFRLQRENHSPKALFTKIVAGQVQLDRNVNKWFNDKRRKGVEDIPSGGQINDAPFGGFIEHTDLPRTADEAYNAVVQELANELVKNPHTLQDALEKIARDAGFVPDLVERVQAGIARKKIIEANGQIDNPDQPSHISYDGTELKVDDWVDWTDYRETVGGRPNPNYGKVYRGQVRQLRYRTNDGKYVYSDSTYVVFPELNRLAGHKPSKQRARIASQLKKVDSQNAPISRPFFAKKAEKGNAERIVPDAPNLVVPADLKRPKLGMAPTNFIPQVMADGSGVANPDFPDFAIPATRVEWALKVADQEPEVVEFADIMPGDMVAIGVNGSIDNMVVNNKVNEDGSVDLRLVSIHWNGEHQEREMHLEGNLKMVVFRSPSQRARAGVTPASPPAQNLDFAVGDRVIVDDITAGEGKIVRKMPFEPANGDPANQVYELEDANGNLYHRSAGQLVLAADKNERTIRARQRQIRSNLRLFLAEHDLTAGARLRLFDKIGVAETEAEFKELYDDINNMRLIPGGTKNPDGITDFLDAAGFREAASVLRDDLALAGADPEYDGFDVARIKYDAITTTKGFDKHEFLDVRDLTVGDLIQAGGRANSHYLQVVRAPGRNNDGIFRVIGKQDDLVFPTRFGMQKNGDIIHNRVLAEDLDVVLRPTADAPAGYWRDPANRPKPRPARIKLGIPDDLQPKAENPEFLERAVREGKALWKSFKDGFKQPGGNRMARGALHLEAAIGKGADGRDIFTKVVSTSDDYAGEILAMHMYNAMGGEMNFIGYDFDEAMNPENRDRMRFRIVMQGIDGKVGAEQTDREQFTGEMDVKENLQIAILDYIGGNWDRNYGNWMVWDKTGKAAPIDNQAIQFRNETDSPFAEELLRRIRQGSAPLTSAELLRMRNNLAALRPLFSKFLRLDGYAFMLNRIDKLIDGVNGYDI